MKTADPADPQTFDRELAHLLEAPPEAVARVVRAAREEAFRVPAAGRPTWRWAKIAAVLALGLAAGFYAARLPEGRSAPRRPEITNVGEVIIAIDPEGGGRLLRSAGAAPPPPGSTLIVRYGGTP
ncbi:MAG TPA: hypothetical protein VMM92_01985 [Thermoanaerobaculia bacterium]|nr:hypothetical protein [Thermoanaerobaculia bacterium]